MSMSFAAGVTAVKGKDKVKLHCSKRGCEQTKQGTEKVGGVPVVENGTNAEAVDTIGVSVFDPGL